MASDAALIDQPKCFQISPALARQVAAVSIMQPHLGSNAKSIPPPGDRIPKGVLVLVAPTALSISRRSRLAGLASKTSPVASMAGTYANRLCFSAQMTIRRSMDVRGPGKSRLRAPIWQPHPRGGGSRAHTRHARHDDRAAKSCAGPSAARPCLTVHIGASARHVCQPRRLSS